MPELPELQALAERLQAALAGAPLQRVEPMQFSALKTVEPGYADLVGSTLAAVARRAKYLILDFGALRLITHLSQGGRVDLEDPPKSTRPKGAVVRFTFEGAPSLLIKEFGTERKAAWWVVAKGDAGPLEGLGPEPFTEEFDRLIATTQERRRLHTFLRDQRAVAGIGRGFTDDILHHARLSPFAAPASLTEVERARLVSSTRTVLEDALALERQRTGGLPAKLSGRFVIHGAHGKACPRCGETMRRISYESHEITYCPTCQTDGKILADRRLSRLLK